VRTLTVVVAALLVAILAACSSAPFKPKNQPKNNPMLGKWRPKEEGQGQGNLVMEITDDQIKTSGPGGQLISPYRWLNDDTIETESTMFGKTFEHQYKVVIEGKQMTWTDEEGRVKRFERIE
jgi:hypothetical protein